MKPGSRRTTAGSAWERFVALPDDEVLVSGDVVRSARFPGLAVVVSELFAVDAPKKPKR